MNIDKGKFLRSLIAIGLLGGAACGKDEPAREVEVAPPPPATTGAEQPIEQKPAEAEQPERPPTVIVQPIEMVPVPVPVPVETQQQRQMPEEEAKPGEQERDLGPTPE